MNKILYPTGGVKSPKEMKYFEESFLESNLFSAILQTLIGMSSEKSIIKELLCLGIEQTNCLPWDKVKGLSKFKEDLELKTDDPKEIEGYFQDNYSIRNFGFSGMSLKNIMFERMTKRYISFAIEILRIVNNLEHTEKYEMLNLFAKYSQAEDFTKYLYTINAGKIELLEDVEKIVNITEPSERYFAIFEYLEIISKKVAHDRVIFESSVSKNDYFLKNFIEHFIKFGIDQSFKNLKILTLTHLYDYCKKKGYLTRTESDSKRKKELLECLDFEIDSYRDEDEKDTAHEAISEKTINKMFEISDLKEDIEYSDKPEDSKSKTKETSSETLEALDGLKDSYKEDKYSFNVKDVFKNDDTLKEKYFSISKKVNLVNQNLIRSIRNIKTYNSGGKEPSKPKGKVDRKNVYKYKYDKNIFFNNDYKQKELDLCFGIILDESGSMYGDGIKNGAITMIVIHETLKALNINHSIVGHTSSGNNKTEIAVYQHFKESKKYRFVKNYALADIYAKQGNCDSGALYFMEKALLNTKNKDKICLIFSDGQPTECTGMELKNQVRKMEKKGIKVIGIGINFKEIKEYYPNNANGKNLTEMLNIVTGILKQYVLDKKD